MNPHLKCIPCLAPLSTRRLPRCNLQGFGRQAYGSLHAQILGFGALDQFLADFFEGLDLARGEGDSDLVDFLGGRVSQWWRKGETRTERGDVLGLRRNPSLASGRTFLRVG